MPTNTPFDSIEASLSAQRREEEPPIPGIQKPQLTSETGMQAFVKSVPFGFIETTISSMDPFVLSEQRRKRKVSTLVERGVVVDEENQNQLLQDITKSDLSTTEKLELTNGIRDFQAGNISEKQLQGLKTKLQKSPVLTTLEEAQAGVRAFAEQEFAVDPAFDDSLFTATGRGMGSVAAFIGVRLANGPVGATVFAASLGASESLQREAQAGAADEDFARTSLLGAAIGTLDMVPIENILKPVTRTKGVRGMLFAIAKRAVENGLIEGTQEGVSGFLQNAVARLHTSDQDLSEGVDQQGLVGFIVGALFGAGAAPFTTTTAKFVKTKSGMPVAPDLVVQLQEATLNPDKAGNIRIDKFGLGEEANLIKETIETAGQTTSTAEGEPVLLRDSPEFAEARRGGRPPEPVTTREQAFDELADAQRGAPEQAMLKVQFANGGGVLNPVVERAGDLIHRMSEKFEFMQGARADVFSKVETVVRALDSKFGFEKEHMINMRNNAGALGIPLEEQMAKVTTALKTYADEHRKLKPLNRPQKLANNIAIAVGEQKWDVARKNAQQLKKLVENEDEYNRAISVFKPSKSEKPEGVAEESVDLINPRVSMPVLKKLANEIGEDPVRLGEVLTRELGAALNAEQIQALRIKVAEFGIDVMEKAKALQLNKTPENRAAAQLAAQKHEAFLRSLAGGTAEAGRTLRILREDVKGEIESKAVVKATELVEAQLGPEATEAQKFDAAMELLATLETPGEVAAFMTSGEVTSKTTTLDKLAEAYVAALLTNPQTHAVNFASNALNLVNSIVETNIAAVLGKTVFIGSKDKVFVREAGARMWGLVTSFPEAGKAFGRGIVNEGIAFDASKFDQRRQRIPGLLGKAVRTPFRLLGASDLMFKAIAYNMEINQQASHNATTRGLKGQARKQFLQAFPKLASSLGKLENRADILKIKDAKRRDEFIIGEFKNQGFTITKPELQAIKKSRLAAINEADYLTFTKRLGPTGEAGLKFLNSHPSLRFIVPFARTPTNILKFAGERVPVAPFFSKKVRKQLFGTERAMILSDEAVAEMAKNFDAVASSKQISRMAVGTSLMSMAWMMVQEGLLTGSGPSDPTEKSMWYSTGEWQPNSFRLSKNHPWISYSRLEPLGILLGVSANFALATDKLPPDVMQQLATATLLALDGKFKEADEAIDADVLGEAGTASVVSITDNLISKTWLTGPSALALALNDPERYGDKFVQQFIGSLAVPAGVAGFARVEDPVLREVNSVLEAVISRTPYWSKTLQPKRQWDGSIISFQGSLGPDFLSPFYMTARPPERKHVANVLRAAGINMKKPPKNIGGVKLEDLPSGEQIYDDYIVTSALGSDVIPGFMAEISMIIDILQTTEDGFPSLWDTMPVKERETLINNAVNRARENARNELRLRYPELDAALDGIVEKEQEFNTGDVEFNTPMMQNLFGTKPLVVDIPGKDSK